MHYACVRTVCSKHKNRLVDLISASENVTENSLTLSKKCVVKDPSITVVAHIILKIATSVARFPVSCPNIYD